MSDLPADPLSALSAAQNPGLVGAKPAPASVTIWSGVAAILSGLGTLALVLAGQLGAEAITPAILSIGGGAGAIFGRLRARQRIA